MAKPTLTKNYKKAELDAMEQEGEVFEKHDGKRIIGKAENAGQEILFLEDGSEVVRGNDGKFMPEWKSIIHKRRKK